ncbi:MAG: hypothetical protein IAE77_09815 [Prosthecobacter sp.]|jgi:hypothetical protein|uniref:hypothetical protein n=1 Tax=Prosthecobacter sp. TaxID=1965333 RepID=UPI0019F4CA2D|nr:hypothetical protein [Prosthecobacter sp.]MBE2283739.1 hypothetical protein [Prosthecobacter sp.]
MQVVPAMLAGQADRARTKSPANTGLAGSQQRPIRRWSVGSRAASAILESGPEREPVGVLQPFDLVLARSLRAEPAAFMDAGFLDFEHAV